MADNPRVKADLANRAAYNADAVAAIPMRGVSTNSTVPKGRKPTDEALEESSG